MCHPEKFSEIVPEFYQRCKDQSIKPIGPGGLNHLIDISTIEINKVEQDKESKAIIDQLGNLLGSIETVLKHVSGVGNGILSAATHFKNMTTSINGRLLPRARKMTEQGRITLPNNKSLPQHLPLFHVDKDDESPMIEGSSEVVKEKVKQLEEVS